MEYDSNYESPSLTLRLKMSNLPKTVESCVKAKSSVYALIWTTTPWSLPGNQAIFFNAEFEYSLIRLDNTSDYYIVSTTLIGQLKDLLPEKNIEMVTTFPGIEFEKCSYLDPFSKTEMRPLLPGDHVKDNKGTGLVHTAPAHGFDDYAACLAQNISMVGCIEKLFYFCESKMCILPEMCRGR